LRIDGFIWDNGNLTHLKHAHPHYNLSELEEIVLVCTKRYIGTDSKGNKVYAAARKNITVLFNHRNNKARIFSIRVK